MGCSWLLLLGLVLNVAHCLETEGAEQTHVICHNATAVLGEAVYLDCKYLGESQILRAEWKRQFNSKGSFKRLAGVSHGKLFSRIDGFSTPESPTNLTVRMTVSSLEAEGQYFCEFDSEEESFKGSLFVTVLARPGVQIRVNEEIIDAIHYQSVSCSAIGARPAPQISWMVGGLPPSDYLFNVTETLHSNGTTNLSSILHFPTHLQDEDSVTCVVQHPTLPNPKLATVRVETYARPNVTIKAEMIQQEGKHFWVVSCISSGGRPDTTISLVLKMTEELRRENDNNSNTQRLSVHLPAADYEGQNITCVFNHPKFTQAESRVITLPVFYMSAVQVHSKVRISSEDDQGTKYLELQEGLMEAVISLEVMGNVPRYNVICKKDDGPLPEGVDLNNSSLRLQGPVVQQQAGVYECDFSYHHISTTLRLNVTVKPQAQQLVPPTIRVDLRSEDGRRVIECVAADAVPAANVSWLLPEGVSADFWSNSTTSNGSHSVRGVLLLPACLPRELTAECVINHPAFEEQENRSVTVPLCARPNITIGASTEWKDGRKYTTVRCSAVSVASAAAISWHAANSSITSLTETEVQAGGLVSTRSSVHFPSSLYAGQNLTCIVKHPTLETPEKRTVHIPVQKAPSQTQLSVSVMRQQGSALWVAVCECRGEGDGTNLAWVLPENKMGETSLHTKNEGHVMKVRLTYKFPLALHEGQDLTCVYQYEHGIIEKKTIHIPKYYISSLRVLNQTTPLRSRYDDQPVIYRVSVHENHPNQKILLRVEGNVPEYSIDCTRSDGSIVQMNGAAIIIQPGDKGLYTCWASFYHHTAMVNIQVEITREDDKLMLITMICIPSAFAILLLLVIILCVCCKRSNGAQYKHSGIQQRESVSALTALMQDPGSPEVKKPAAAAGDSKDYAQISYSIVIDVKSKV